MSQFHVRLPHVSHNFKDPNDGAQPGFLKRAELLRRDLSEQMLAAFYNRGSCFSLDLPPCGDGKSALSLSKQDMAFETGTVAAKPSCPARAETVAISPELCTRREQTAVAMPLEAAADAEYQMNLPCEQMPAALRSNFLAVVRGFCS